MKKLIVLTLVFVLAVSAFAGGAKEGGAAKKVTANIASTFPPDSPQDKGMNKFKQLVAERAGGRVEILIHPSNAMGDEKQTFELLSQGSVEYGALGSNDISTYFPKYYISEFPKFSPARTTSGNTGTGSGKGTQCPHRKERGVSRRRHLPRGARLSHHQPPHQPPSPT
jgi:TRAP-type C4-dicarboxylate transport system substrate-binding protein